MLIEANWKENKVIPQMQFVNSLFGLRLKFLYGE